MATISTLSVSLNLMADSFNNGLKDAQREAKAFADTIKPTTKLLDDMGDAMKGAGTVMTTAITVPLALIGGLAVKAASDFESSFAGVRKTVDATEAEFNQLSGELRKMAMEIPVSVGELNKIAEAAGQLGIKKEDIVQFTRTMADLGVTTNLTADQAATAVAQVQNIFGAAGKDVDRFGATLVALGNAGASTEKDIIDMTLRIAGAGHQVGLTQAQTLSFASALSSVGINAEAGGSAISRVFLKINDAVASGGPVLTEWARVAGMKTADFKKAFETDAAGATTAFIAGLGRIKGEGENVNATLEGLVGKNIIVKDTLMRASGAGDMLAATLKLGNKAWEDNTALVNEAAQRYKTFESQFAVFKNQINDVAITIGTALLPVITGLIDYTKPLIAGLSDAAKWFTELPVPIQAGALALAAMAAAAGPVLLVLGTMASGLSDAIGLFTRLSFSISGTSGLTSAMTLLGGAGGVLGVATIAAVALVAIYYKWKDATEDITRVNDALGKSLAENSTATKAMLGIQEQVALGNKNGIEMTDRVVIALNLATKEAKAAEAQAQANNAVTKELTGSMSGMSLSMSVSAESTGKATAATTVGTAALIPHAAAVEKVTAATRARIAEDEKLVAQFMATRAAEQNNAIVTSMFAANLENATKVTQGLREAQMSLQDGNNKLEQMMTAASLANTSIVGLGGAMAGLKATPPPVWAPDLKAADDAAKALAETARNNLKTAVNDVRESAGKIFDDMKEKGVAVFSDLVGMLKGGALSLGRSIFQDITSAVFGPILDAFRTSVFEPIKAGFSSLFGGIMESTGLKSLLSKLGSKIGGVISGAIGIGGGAGGAAGVGGGAAGAGGLGLSGAGSAIAGFATNPVTIAVAGAIAATVIWLKTQAHWQANTFVQEFQNPLQAELAKIVDNHTATLAAGKATVESTQAAIIGIEALWGAFQDAAEEFGTKGSDEATVAKQGIATIGPLVTQLLASANQNLRDLQSSTAATTTSTNNATAATSSSTAANNEATAATNETQRALVALTASAKATAMAANEAANSVTGFGTTMKTIGQMKNAMLWPDDDAIGGTNQTPGGKTAATIPVKTPGIDPSLIPGFLRTPTQGGGLNNPVRDAAVAAAQLEYARAAAMPPPMNVFALQQAAVALQAAMAMPAYATGDPFVEKTGPAIVHRGERVVTASDNESLTDLLREMIAIGKANLAAVREKTRLYVDGKDLARNQAGHLYDLTRNEGVVLIGRR